MEVGMSEIIEPKKGFSFYLFTFQTEKDFIFYDVFTKEENKPNYNEFRVGFVVREMYTTDTK